MRFKSYVLATLVPLIALSSIGVSKAVDEFPPMLLGFLRPGTQFTEKDGFSTITIIAEDKRALFDDAQRLSKDDLVQKYPNVAKNEKDLLERYRSTQDSRIAELPEGKKFGEPRIELPKSRGSNLVYTIKHIGNDYILVTYQLNEQVKTQAFAKTLISKIHWYEGPSFSLYDTLADN